MTRIALLLMSASVLLFSCKKDDTVLPTHQYEERTSGNMPLGPASIIVVENQVGPVIIEGSANPAEIGWFLNKSVTVESQSAADQIFSQVLVSLHTSNDTAYVSVLFPSGTAYCSTLLSLTVPNYTPCILRRVSGTTHVLYLQSRFSGENLGTTTILGHYGDCELTGASGDVAVETSLRHNGICRVAFNSGDITIRIPSSTSSMLSAQTGNGTVSYSALVLRDSIQTARSLAGRLGTGSGSIELTTGTGNISIIGF